MLSSRGQSLMSNKSVFLALHLSNALIPGKVWGQGLKMTGVCLKG